MMIIHLLNNNRIYKYAPSTRSREPKFRDAGYNDN